MEVAGYFGMIDTVGQNNDKSNVLITESLKPTTVDLSFLTDRERVIILKVIKADLELKRTTLG